MKYEELRALEEKLGEEVERCDWCNRWIPISHLGKSHTYRKPLRFFRVPGTGIKTCYSCLRRMRSSILSNNVTDFSIWAASLLGGVAQLSEGKVTITFLDREVKDAR